MRTVRERQGEGADCVLPMHQVGSGLVNCALAPGDCFAQPSRDQRACQQPGGGQCAGQGFERRVMGLPGATKQCFRAGWPCCQQIEMA